ncbi:hypothetical protein CsatB_020891 [Cannabis sativa]
MKGNIICVAVVFIFVLSVPASMSIRNIAGGGEDYKNEEVVVMKRVIPETEIKVAGSRLPDCSHACGSCSPCRLVMVSFVCASLAEAETCPMAYKCMCKNKSYPVP